VDIFKFQNGTKDFDVGVLFYTHGEEYRLQSDDAPKSELYLQCSNVVVFVLDYLGLKGLHATLKEIVFGSGQNGKTTRLTLSVPTTEGNYAKLLLPKISRADLCDSKSKEPILGHPRNLYNEAMDLLEEMIKDYVHGRRQQAVLDFEAEEERLSEDGGDQNDEDDHEYIDADAEPAAASI
jgi:hypothetical protein